ncbi:MAG TPA: hypothetical protein VMZ92_12010 [Planctomycetota bacterium]|nr:hypothetical protein [Planctomycetota bacterium]
MSELTVVWWSLAPVAVGRRGPRLDTATWWLAGLFIGMLVLFVIAGAIIYVIRSRAIRAESTRTDVPLTLADLRRMHRDGEVDDDEMETLKKVITEQTRKGLDAGPVEAEEKEKT